MRVAVLVIGLCLVMLVGMQSCAVMVGGGLADDKDLTGGGAIGLLIAFLFVLGSAFAIGAPKASMIMFIVAALFGFIAGAGSEFKDMNFWAIVSIGLAVMSYFGIKEKKKKEIIQQQTEYQ